METRLRLLIVLGGLPEPDTNMDAFDAAGEWIARRDLSYPKLRIALECDGSAHLTPRQRRKDIRRREMYDSEGWRVLVVVERDLVTFPSQTRMRI